jgi:hypothetical protein
MGRFFFHEFKEWSQEKKKEHNNRMNAFIVIRSEKPELIEQKD